MNIPLRFGVAQRLPISTTVPTVTVVELSVALTASRCAVAKGARQISHGHLFCIHGLQECKQGLQYMIFLLQTPGDEKIQLLV